eukprot:CAMPEP_0184015278 /NCGR_PEP_ID=MMETSP0954-20121128/6200_1 /TAXON_ID=627963 /ORGANISM="Aplanochytrium sp, Strain PBS07" /LENGTH=385 /DNA_ID=CAMNT_0026296001 /DNA_START=120 /DNA_END=1275 /DNA_ORIENTATION=+
MHSRTPFLFLPTIILAFGTLQTAGKALAEAGGTDPLAVLSDEFEDPSSISNWNRAYIADGWANNLVQNETLENGRLTVVPFASGWFEQQRGNFYYKEVTGDFVVTARISAAGKDGGIPSSPFSLGGLMAGMNSNSVAGSWEPLSEFWTFIAMGTGDMTDSQSQFEVKTTLNSNSTLELRTMALDGVPAQVENATLQIARIGSNFIILIKLDGGEWEVFRCYGAPSTGASAFPQSQIPDASGPVQVGMHMYSDYFRFIGSNAIPTANEAPARVEQADLVISYDWIRFCSPNVPTEFNSTNWFGSCNSTKNNNPNPWTDNCCIASADVALPTFLGDNGFSCVFSNSSSTPAPVPDSTPAPVPDPTPAPSSASVPTASFVLFASSILA